MKILIIFIAAIVVIAIILGKDPSTLFAGLGAASAILMLAFQDTIKGLVAGIRLTSNDMLHIGDWITVPSAGANGTVEEISLTMVKVRNFDNTIVTVTPQTLVDGSFQNWLGMQQREGRKQTRRLYFDFRSIRTDSTATPATPVAPSVPPASAPFVPVPDGSPSGPTTNITRYRRHIEAWLSHNPAVLPDKAILVRQAEATQAGCCLEFIFWLRAQDAMTYEHDTSDIMEYVIAAANDYGLRIYQQFPEQ
jgi:miniconductance mechanosensitive channel